MVSVVSAQKFYKAFFDQWNDDRKDNCEALRQAYRNAPGRTAYMLGKKGEDFSKTFFDRLATRLGQEPLRERQNLDVVYYTTKAQNICHKERIRPACFNVIIEHETDKKVEEEMWKMLMWRAPLKVLVFYDWSNNERKKKPEKAQWLENKLRQLYALRQEVNREWPEADDTSYLFLIGRPPQRGALPVWWRCYSSEKTRRPLKPMRLKIVNPIRIPSENPNSPATETAAETPE